ncbi:MAG: RsmB/NOP family class I SAM-dependent RNA methyltransferase [Treponema sp.]|nr:RsmB/NOP family class I SAM-dependent RNA methyltransferase [Treponema sp.]
MANKAGKKNKGTNDSNRGEQGFNIFYQALYGSRWENLKQAFAMPADSVEFKLEGAQKPYYLDSASLYAAQCLPLEGAVDILDLCAAPGGKTLVLASRMGRDAVLSSNERSAQRKHRLSVVVEECLPPDISERVRVSCSDGATWCTRQTECFDSILLDAPCSSERHVFADPKYLEQWSPSRIKTVTTEQWSLLSSAFRLLRRGGWLLYSTCALCPQENDLMIARLEKKFGSESFVIERQMLPPTTLKLEQTQYGYHILPDASNGAGPIYFSLIKKQ